MIILALDLGNFTSSLALLKDGEILHSEHSDVFRGQDVTLLPKIQGILHDHDLAFSDLSCVAATTGPGSFTGIRVALATAQGIGFAAKVAAVGIPTMDLVMAGLAGQFEAGQKVLVLLESLRLELYAQLFNGTGQALGPPITLAPEDIAQEAKYEGAVCVGNGAKHMAAHGFEVRDYMPKAVEIAEFTATLAHDQYAHYPCFPVYGRGADTSMPKKKG